MSYSKEKEAELFCEIAESVNNAVVKIFDEQIICKEEDQMEGWQIEAAIKALGAVLDTQLKGLSKQDEKFSLEVREEIILMLKSHKIRDKLQKVIGKVVDELKEDLEEDIAMEEAKYATKN